MAKAMKQGLIARKRGMTQVFAGDGNSVPVTVLEAGPCTVVQVKTRATDGYDALQLGFEPKRKKVRKPMAGHFKKAGVGAVRVLREVRLESVEGYQVGQSLTVDLFKPGELVDVTGLRKGRGFQGGIKRHGWSGGEASHGSMFHRAPGSIGASSDPSRVFPGHRLPGRMGAVQVTTPHLEVVRVLPEQHLLVVKGAVPGATGGLLLVRKSVKLSKAQQHAAAKKA
jgi:large subunit ribosomal protein L3